MNLKYFLKDGNYDGIQKRIYAPSDVREQFPQFRGLQDKTVVPVLEELLECWLNKWGIDEMEPMHPQEDLRLNPSLAPHIYPYVFAVDNKLVKVLMLETPLSVFQTSVHFNDRLRHYEFMGKITFYGIHQESVEKLYQQFRDFSGQQDIKKIISQCRKWIEAVSSAPIRFNVEDLDQELINFYLKK